MKVLLNVLYNHESEECKLDLYFPDEGFNETIIHFHGGGLSSGAKDDYAHKEIAKAIVQAGISFISVNYRMYPNAKTPDFFVDAAKSIKYVFNFFEENKINSKIYVSGQSAGAYIAMMLCFNETYLKNVGLEIANINGWIIESGQPTTHFNVLKEMGFDAKLQRIDEYAPLYYVNNKTTFERMLLISYTEDIPLRLEQNEYLYKTILHYNPDANIIFKVYNGVHCLNSIKAVDGEFKHASIMIDFINNKL